MKSFIINGAAEVRYTTSGYTMQSFDFDVMRCLVGIQHDQDTTCVDSMNSPCATANTSIGNLRKDWWNGLWQSGNVGNIRDASRDRLITLINEM